MKAKVKMKNEALQIAKEADVIVCAMGETADMSGDFYGRASVYLSGRRMEIEQFRRIRSYEEGKLCLELGCGTLTVYGDDLKIETLSARRLTLRGQILRTDFSKE